MASPISPLSKLEIKLIVAGKMLLHLPSSTPKLLKVLKDIEQILSGVQQAPPESINNAMPPIIEAMIAKVLVKHPDMDVNISVASCICEILRIMAPESPYNDEQMKDFFEMVVITFEKLSSVSGGCYTKMSKVIKLFSDVRVAVLMLDLDEVSDGLVIRLFKQFLTVADSNTSAVVHEMENIMTMILEEAEDLHHELLGLIVASVKNDNQIASPVCLQLGKKVLMNCAAQLPDMGRDMSVALYDYSQVIARICKDLSENDITAANETIPLTSEISKLRNDTAHKKKNGCLKTVRRCQQEEKTLVYDNPPFPYSSETDVKGKRKRNNTPVKKPEAKESNPLTTDISKLTKETTVTRCQLKKKSVSFEDSQIPSKPETEVKRKQKRSNTPLKKQALSDELGENLVGSRIKVWWSDDGMYYEGVVKSFDCIQKMHKLIYEDGQEELLDLNLEQWKFVENVSSKSDYGALEHGKNLVGKRIKVWWPFYDTYYNGVVKSYDFRERKHKISYDDGDEELTWLKGRRWEFLENVSAMSDSEAKESFPITTLRRCQRKKKTVSFENPQKPSKSVTEVNGKRERSNTLLEKQMGKHLVGSRIKVWWPDDGMYYKGVVKSFDCIQKRHKLLYEDGQEELLDLKLEQWKLVKNVSSKSDYALEHGENLVGKRIKVWWPFYNTYYEGVVESFDSTERKHKISYDDGDEELTNLEARRWKLIKIVSAGKILPINSSQCTINLRPRNMH